MSHKSKDIILKVENLVKKFGNFRALNGVSIEVERGKVIGLAGPNGSGKTTFINVVSGVYKANGGRVIFDGESIYNMEPHKIVHKGLNRTFQIPKPLLGLTVEENIRVAAVYGSKNRKDVESKIEYALNTVGLLDFRFKKAANLTSTQQKLLDLGRALATEPKLLLVDEIAAGLSQKELRRIADMLLGIKNKGVTMIVVEHLMGFLDMITDEVIIMNAGVEIFKGSVKEASENEEVIRVFLGG